MQLLAIKLEKSTGEHKLQHQDIRQQRRKQRRLHLPSRMAAHSRMAISAPVLRPGELLRASTLHSSMLPSRSQVHTLTVRVPVLLCMG